MNPWRFVLGVIALLLLCGASRGAEWKRMPVGPVEADPSLEQSMPEVARPGVASVSVRTGSGWSQVSVTGPRAGNEAAKNKDTRKDERQPSFPRIRGLFGRFRGQG
ncbi:MAG TPA: hypothetical protein VKI17_05075 [Gemmataceae bacterium]|nr:hypothetical protein [Gemmataceae bacterium]